MLPLAPTKLSQVILCSLLMPSYSGLIIQEDQIESHNGRIKSLEKELEEHKAYHENVNRKAKGNQVSNTHDRH